MANDNANKKQEAAQKIFNDHVKNIRDSWKETGLPRNVPTTAVECLSMAVRQVAIGEIDNIRPEVFTTALEGLEKIRKGKVSVPLRKVGVMLGLYPVNKADRSSEDSYARQSFSKLARHLGQKNHEDLSTDTRDVFYNFFDELSNKTKLELLKNIEKKSEVSEEIFAEHYEGDKILKKLSKNKNIPKLEEKLKEAITSEKNVQRYIGLVEDFMGAVIEAEPPIINGNGNDRTMIVNNSLRAEATAKAKATSKVKYKDYGHIFVF